MKIEFDKHRGHFSLGKWKRKHRIYKGESYKIVHSQTK